MGEEARRQLVKILAFKNYSKDCKHAMLPIKETGDVKDYMKVCKNILSEHKKMHFLQKLWLLNFMTYKRKINQIL